MYSWSSNPTVSNAIFWDNRDATGIGTADASITNDNSIPMINSSLIQGSGGSDVWNNSVGEDDGGNIDSDPLFVSPIELFLVPTISDDLSLLSGSPAIDAGNTLSYDAISTVTTDLAGNPRIVNTIDMGAYEFGCSINNLPRRPIDLPTPPNSIEPPDGKPCSNRPAR